MKTPVLAMEVVFYNEDDGRLCGWRAAPPKRRRFQVTTMASGRDLPHDLAQFVVEALSVSTTGSGACSQRERPSKAFPGAAVRGRANSWFVRTVRSSTGSSVS